MSHTFLKKYSVLSPARRKGKGKGREIKKKKKRKKWHCGLTSRSCDGLCEVVATSGPCRGLYDLREATVLVSMSISVRGQNGKFYPCWLARLSIKNHASMSSLTFRGIWHFEWISYKGIASRTRMHSWDKKHRIGFAIIECLLAEVLVAIKEPLVFLREEDCC